MADGWWWGWRAMAELDSADGFPHSYLIMRSTRTSISDSIPHFPGMPDDLKDSVMICQAMDYIRMMGVDPMKCWQILPGTVTGLIVRQPQWLRTLWKSARGVVPQASVLWILEHLHSLESHAVVSASPELGTSVLRERGGVPFNGSEE